MKKRYGLIFLILALVFSGCLPEITEPNADFYMYYKAQNKQELYPVPADCNLASPREELIPSIFQHLKDGADEAEYTSPLSSDIMLLDFIIEDTNLVLNISGTYSLLSPRAEILARGALVKTFAQIPEISTLEVRVEGQPLTLSDGTVPVAQKAEDFINPFQKGLDELKKADVLLYFASEDGERLVAEKREIRYQNQISKEQAVMTELLLGTTMEGHYPIMDHDVKILSVTAKNNVCYVDFSESFLDGMESVLPEVTVYGIVNSLTELSGVGSVQITVKGSPNRTYMEKVDLSKPVLRNPDYIEKEE